MNRSILIHGFTILILASFLAGCSGASPVKAPAVSTPTPESPLHLESCQLGGTAAQCGTLRVYENRASRSGRMIDLRVAVIKARDPNPAPDPIFYLAGGPGVAATEDAKRQQFPSSLTASHDVVFVDQRGTGGSHRVVIPPSPDLSGLSQGEAESKARAWAAQVISEMDMDPRFYTTSVAMDDLDEVRQALGYEKINLFGHSYGATAVQYYLRQHEEHVRTAIISGGSLLDVPVFERWTANGQRVLDLLFDRCAADTACQAAYPSLRQEFAGLLNRLEQEPVSQNYTPSNQQSGTVTFTRDYLAEIVRVLTLEEKNAVGLPRAIHRAYAQDDWTDIVHAATTYGAGDWGDQMMEIVIRCSEKWADNSPQEVARIGAGTYLEGWYNQLAATHAFVCQLIPKGEMPEGRGDQPRSQVPVLLLTGEADPQNPPDNVSGYQELWPNSLLVVEPYQGHWLSDIHEIMCRWSIEEEFIQKGSVAGLHTECMQTVEPLPFLMDD